MNNSQVHIVEREPEQAPRTRSERIISDAERRVCRAGQLVERQRQLVSKIGDRMPAAAVLLRNFEHSAALLEQTLATYRHNDLIAARVKDAIYSSNATLPPTTPTEANEPSLAKLAYEAQMRDVGRLMEILREGGYHCELAGDTLH